MYPYTFKTLARLASVLNVYGYIKAHFDLVKRGKSQNSFFRGTS